MPFRLSIRELNSFTSRSAAMCERNLSGLDSADILALMRALYSDTDPKIEQMQIECIRCMPPWRKMSMVDLLYAENPEQLR